MDEEKKNLRLILRHRRLEADVNAQQSSQGLMENVLSSVSFAPESLIGGYIRTGHEIDPSLLMEALRAQGHLLSLPCVTGLNDVLTFRAYLHGLPLHLGPFDILEPINKAPVVDPEVYFVPLVGFDRKGHRLGQGGGYFDRTLRAARARRKIKAIGLAYALQEEEALPFGPDDECLDLIVTEKEIIDPSV